jgi:zinc protease
MDFHCSSPDMPDRADRRLYNWQMTTSARRSSAEAQLDARATSLDNGMKVLVREVHTAPLVSLWCWYRVGSGDERPGLTGVSHWCEHMNFKGTTNIPRDQVKGIIDRYGGFWNGYTWVDQTTYMETAPREALDKMMFIESERMSQCLYDAAECDSERTVIISELQGNENDPDQLLDTEVAATAFRVHPYGHPTIGWLGDLERISRDDLYTHYQNYYCPNNATVVVVGDVDTDDVFRRVERAFGQIPPAATPERRRTPEPPQLGERRVTIEREGTTAYLKVAYRAPAVTHDDFVPMLVLDAVLTGAKGLNLWASFRAAPPQRRSRLYRALVDERLAAAVGGACLPTVDPYLFMVSVTVAADRTRREVEDATLAVLDNVAASGITAAELERGVRQLRARMVFENDSITNVAHQLGFFETVTDLDTLASLPARIARVSVEDVSRVAASYLVAHRRTVGWYAPLGA